jgi:membrane protein
VWHEAITDRAMLTAGGLAFFTLLGLLPAVAAIGAIYGLTISPEALEQQIVALEEILPEPIVGVLREFLTDVPSRFGLGLGLVIHLLIVLWTVQRSASGIITGLNLTHSIEETRSKLSREGVALAIAAAGLLFVAAALFLVAVIPLAAPALAPPLDGVLLLLRWPVAALLFLAYLWGIYRLAPAIPPRKPSWISIGALVATGLWLAASALFSLYVSTIGGFSAYYGSATAPVVLLAWLFITSWVVLIGAEVNEQLIEAHEGKPEDDVKARVDRA